MAETEYFQLTMYLTIVLIVFKCALAAYLGQRVLQKTRQDEKFRVNFLFSVLVLVIGLAISRSLYFYYDFFLTKFDPNLLYHPNYVNYWRVATVITGYFGSIVLYVIDRDIYRFKLKRIPVFVIIAVATFQAVYPIRNAEDFNLVSAVGTVVSAIAVIVPLTFLYLAIKSSGELRRTSLTFAIGITLFAIIGILMSEPVLLYFDENFGLRGFIIVFVPIGKIICLAFLGNAATKMQI
jgi:hypothetical protein